MKIYLSLFYFGHLLLTLPYTNICSQTHPFCDPVNSYLTDTGGRNLGTQSGNARTQSNLQNVVCFKEDLQYIYITI